MSALDAGFLELEDAHVAVHLGVTAVFEGPVPELRELMNRFEHVVNLHPRYRQIVSRAPFDVRRPGWLDAPRLDLDYHVRRTALPAPGTFRELEELVGRIMSGRLDPERPLWEAWIVEGIEGGRWAIVLKVHHSIVDGVGGMATLLDLLDPTDGDAMAAMPIRTTVAPQGGRGAAFAPGRRVVNLIRNPVAAAAAITRTVLALPAGLRILRPTVPTSLNGELERSREYRTLTVAISDVRAVRHVFGGTTNDVVLAMVSHGFHKLLTARGEPLGPTAVRCLVPINLRDGRQAKSDANKITLVLVDLPVDVADVRDAYLAIRSRARHIRGSGTARAVGTGFALADRVPSGVAAAVLAAARHVHQRIVTTITTNVPGPSGTQSLLGRRLVALFPYVPLAERIRIAVALTSYEDRLHFGITSDRRSVADADVFVDAMRVALRDLVTSARGDAK